jgi:MFS family permease
MEDLDPQVVWDSEVSLHNWIEKFDLKCASHIVEASFAMVLFSGWMIGSFFVPQLSDKFGRKKIFAACISV